MRQYELKVFPKTDADGNIYWTAAFPAVDGCVGGGETADEAVKEAFENLEIYLEFLEENGIEPPKEQEENHCSGKIALRISKSTHKKLNEKAAEEGISTNLLLNNAIEYYLGIREYDYKFNQKIQEIQEISTRSLRLQLQNFILNQQAAQWKQADLSPITLAEDYE